MLTLIMLSAKIRLLMLSFDNKIAESVMTKFELVGQIKKKRSTFYLNTDIIEFIHAEMAKIQCSNMSWFMNQLLAKVRDNNISE